VPACEIVNTGGVSSKAPMSEPSPPAELGTVCKDLHIPIFLTVLEWVSGSGLTDQVSYNLKENTLSLTDT
jgi:hypothetical protein